jgi:hypothetical protein
MNVADWLASRGLDLPSLGGAYLFLLASLTGTALCYYLARRYTVISPNQAARHYGLHVAVVMIALLVATVLENELVPGRATLSYSAVPQILLLLIVHVWIHFRQDTRLIALGAASVAGSALAMLVFWALTSAVHYPHWVALAVLAALLAVLSFKSVSTQRGFMTAKSIYVDSKEHPAQAAVAGKPWLGLAQWVGLICASLLLAALNAVLRGGRPAEVPATEVMMGSAELIAVTAIVAAVPTASYWLARRHWMPELTRFVWLVWLVVGFAFSYGNFLKSLA